MKTIDNYFTFNGISSKDLNIVVTKPVIRPSWELERTEVTIPNKSKKMFVDSKTYANAEMTIETFVRFKELSELHKIYSTFTGKGILWLSTAKNEYINAIAHCPAPEAIAVNSGLFQLKFTLIPFAYAVNPTIVEINTQNSYKQVNNGGTLYSEPLISFVSLANQDIKINVNGADFTVTHPDSCTFDSTIFIDCEEQIVYFQRPEGTLHTCMQYTTGDLPLLHTGENYVKYSGNVSNFKINVKERFL